MIRYSICITNFNNALTLRSSLNSILHQIDERFEVVVVDNLSTDGSAEILKEYEKDGKIRLISHKCSRGKGRQLAFENSIGTYVIANLDTDDIFEKNLFTIIKHYHRLCEGTFTWVVTMNRSGRQGGWVTIAPREVIAKIGGWNDLQRGEDWEIARRAFKINLYRWGKFPLLVSNTIHSDMTALEKFRFSFVTQRDRMRIGRKAFGPGEHKTILQRLAEVLALASLPFYEQYKEGNAINFIRDDPKFYVDFQNDS
ncbi:MAG: glycosyltransferase family 2 protein [Nitrososphaerota archaeon]|nr:glycosyltransferase family 2 protein [Nitrososphaerota archaeon]